MHIFEAIGIATCIFLVSLFVNWVLAEFKAGQWIGWITTIILFTLSIWLVI